MERYETLGMVGEGSYGTVLKCRHRDTGKIVAVKKFLESDDDKTVKKIALREIKMLKQLRHDNLVNLLEVWRRRRRWYLVFEFVERTVLDELEQNPRGLDFNTTRQYLYQILRATAFCHQHNVVHRDIKPENILVSQVGVVKLCDFGFARTMAAPGEVCVYTDYVATRWYRAPELLVGDTKYGKPVDVWALGCLLIEMVTGEPLFPGDSDLDQVYHIIRCFGNLTARHQELFYRNPVFSGVRLPDVSTRLSLHQRYPRLSHTVLSLALSCLQMDPERREQCSDLLQHHYFTHDHFHTRFVDELNVMIQKDQRENSTLPKIPKTPRREREEGEEKSSRMKDKKEEGEERSSRMKDKKEEGEERSSRMKDKREEGEERSSRMKDKKEEGEERSSKIKDKKEEGEERSSRMKDKKEEGEERSSRMKDKKEEGEERSSRMKDKKEEGEERSSKMKDKKEEGEERSSRMKDKKEEGEGRSSKIKDKKEEGEERSSKIKDKKEEGEGRSSKIKDKKEEGEGRSSKIKDKSNSKPSKTTGNTSHLTATTKPWKNTGSKLSNNTAVPSKAKPGKNNISDQRKDAEMSKSYKSSTFERSDSTATVFSVSENNAAVTKSKPGRNNASDQRKEVLKDAETSKSSKTSTSECSESTGTLMSVTASNETRKSKPGKTDASEWRREPGKDPENYSSTKPSTADDTNSTPKLSKTLTIDHCGTNLSPKTSRSFTVDRLDTASASKPVKPSTVNCSDVTKTANNTVTASATATLTCKTSTSQTSPTAKPSKTFTSEPLQDARNMEMSTTTSTKPTGTIKGTPNTKPAKIDSSADGDLPDDSTPAPTRPPETLSTDMDHTEVLTRMATASATETAPIHVEVRTDSTESGVTTSTMTKPPNAPSSTDEQTNPDSQITSERTATSNVTMPPEITKTKDPDTSSAVATKENFTASSPNPNRPLSPPIPPPPSSSPVIPPFSFCNDSISLVANGNLCLGVGPNPGTHSLRCIDKVRRHGMYSRIAQQSLSSHCTGTLTAQVFSEKCVIRERSFLSDHGNHGNVAMAKRKSDLRFPELRNSLLPELRGSDGKHSTGSNKDQKKRKGPVSSISNTHTLQRAHDSQDTHTP